MRLTKSGKRYVQDLSAQHFPRIDRDPYEALLTETRNYIDQLQRYAPRWRHGDDVAVTTARWACENLLILLERMR